MKVGCTCQFSNSNSIIEGVMIEYQNVYLVERNYPNTKVCKHNTKRRM